MAVLDCNSDPDNALYSRITHTIFILVKKGPGVIKSHKKHNCKLIGV